MAKQSNDAFTHNLLIAIVALLLILIGFVVLGQNGVSPIELNIEDTDGAAEEQVEDIDGAEEDGEELE
jgi:hypothetical protein